MPLKNSKASLDCATIHSCIVRTNFRAEEDVLVNAFAQRCVIGGDGGAPFLQPKSTPAASGRISRVDAEIIQEVRK